MSFCTVFGKNLMAKTQNRGTTGNSKIRFIMLEADLNDGNLTQITQAISSALSRTNTPHRLIAAPVNSAPALASVQEAEDQVADETGTSDATNQEEEMRLERPRKARKFPVPKVLNVDLNSGPLPFATFAEKAPDSDLGRFLVVAHWFKAQRNVGQVTADHAFTCYKKMGWGTDIKDFAQPFRDLARKGKGEVKDGKFTINHIGEDSVEKMLK
jgi:hypothetical protein